MYCTLITNYTSHLFLFTTATTYTFFPDITPNGSLRRRRSRVLSEEDEGNLMDFLRSSGHDSNRERKSWGSLGKSSMMKNTNNQHLNTIYRQIMGEKGQRQRASQTTHSTRCRLYRRTRTTKFTITIG